MNMTGTIYLSTDQNFCINMATSHIIVCVSGETQSYPQFIQMVDPIIASVLIPPYEACMAQMNGDMESFNMIYRSYLSSGESFKLLGLLLKSLYLGKNIIIYCTNDEMQMGYMQSFIQYLYDSFGICVGTQTNQFMYYHNAANVHNMEVLYYLGFCSYKELFEAWKSHPVSCILSEQSIIKLANELRLFMPTSNIETYYNKIVELAFDNLEIPVSLGV